LYAEHLGRFFKWFAQEQILVLRHEDLAKCPERVALAFQSFVGVTHMPRVVLGLGQINATEASPTDPLPAFLRRQLAERYRAANAELSVLLGSNFDAWSD